ncbi:MAG: adenylate/guanylate cyclase domain-containing protein [Acidobacteriota bacterium]
MRQREPTKGTEIAALEAQRNEDQVRAEGSLLGEKRAAVARLVMILMFALVSVTRAGPHNWRQSAVGTTFMAYALVALIGTWRIKQAKPSRALWAPIIFTTLDFTGTAMLGGLDIWWTGQFQSGQHAVASAILISFAIARRSIWHVALSVAMAEASYLVLAGYAGTIDTHATAFIMAGYLVLGFMVALTNRAVGRMFAGLRQRDNLTRFLPRQVAERVIAQGPSALAPVEREITVLFSDIRGFTGLSEGMGPREVLVMLDDYFGRMSQIVKGHDGVVGKFLGDGLLAFWGVPDRVDDHARRAVKAARDMRRVLVEYNRDRERGGLPPIKIGIGIHTGMVAAGMLGGQLQAEYTVIGDAVNVASRIEGLTKEHAVDVLISETTWAQLGDGGRTRRLAEGAIRGRKEPVVLYALDD